MHNKRATVNCQRIGGTPQKIYKFHTAPELRSADVEGDSMRATKMNGRSKASRKSMNLHPAQRVFKRSDNMRLSMVRLG